MFLKQHVRFICFLTYFSLFCSSVAAQSAPPNVAGSWQISWEARIGRESGTIQFEQIGTKLTGTYHGHGSPCPVEGTLAGNSVSFHLQFQTSQPYTLNFMGLMDGNRMSGMFNIRGLADGYDSHGENVQRTDYTWTATRRLSNASQSKQEEESKSSNPK